MAPLKTNALYYGDNLRILRDYIPDESVDLIYLDPPFNSNRSYNVLFKETSAASSQAQIEAFEDTWHWGKVAQETFEDIALHGGDDVARLLKAMVDALGHNDVTAYLTMMAARLGELRRVLKPTGSVYLHCDPTAGHYLKVLMDAVFGPKMFRSEIVWRRTGAHNKSNRYAPVHDTILFYSRGQRPKWKHHNRPYMKGHVEEYFVKDDTGYRTNYYGNVLTGSGTRNGESGKPWMGVDPTAKGRHWAIPHRLLDEISEDLSSLTQHQKLDRLYELGHIKIVPGEAWPIYEHHITPSDGQPMSDIWAFQPYTGGTVFGTDKGIDEDVRWLSTRDKERLGYQTQKPLALLERIISSSSDEDDVVLDPFCGCGTAVHAAHKLGRQWIGIDITHLAIGLVRRRMEDAFAGLSIEVVGEPVDLSGAAELAANDPYQFQWWAIDKIDAVPVGDKKKGMDRGIDGIIPFLEGRTDRKRVMVSVKGGGTGSKDVRDLKGVLDREGEPIGILVTLRPPTKEMTLEAVAAGHYESPFWKKKYPRIQILTIADILNGKKVEMPPAQSIFARAERERDQDGEQAGLSLG